VFYDGLHATAGIPTVLVVRPAFIYRPTLIRLSQLHSPHSGRRGEMSYCATKNSPPFQVDEGESDSVRFMYFLA
jgi:hypothetical protein